MRTRNLMVILALGLGLCTAASWLGLRACEGAEPDLVDAVRQPREGEPAGEPAVAIERAPLTEPTPLADPPAARPDFDAVVDRLVTLGLRLHDAVDADDVALARATDDEARALLIELRDGLPDADHRALQALTALCEAAATRPIAVRRHVLARILEQGLAERWRRHDELRQPRQVVDPLVEAIVLAIPAEAELARTLGLGLLAGKPYLGPAHESAVLALADIAIERTFVAPIASALLTTLWQNLARDGARSASSLASLALLFKDDANPSRKQAALEHLLAIDNGRYRELVVRQVINAKDSQLAACVAQAAASKLDPDDGLAVVERLTDVAGDRLVSAYMVLGSRDVRALGASYEQKLADGTAPHVRAQLVTGIGFDPNAAELDLVRIAFEQDPDRTVRERALFALAASRDAAVAEQTLATALDDPRDRDDPRWLGSIALALQNLAELGDANALDRIGRRLEQHPRLLPEDRAQLRNLLAQHLPAQHLPAEHRPAEHRPPDTGR